MKRARESTILGLPSVMIDVVIAYAADTVAPGSCYVDDDPASFHDGDEFGGVFPWIRRELLAAAKYHSIQTIDATELRILGLLASTCRTFRDTLSTDPKWAACLNLLELRFHPCEEDDDFEYDVPLTYGDPRMVKATSGATDYFKLNCRQRFSALYRHVARVGRIFRAPLLLTKSSCELFARHDSAQRLVDGWEDALGHHATTAQHMLEDNECDLSSAELDDFEAMVAGCTIERTATVCLVDFVLRDFRKSGLSHGYARTVVLEGWRNFSLVGVDGGYSWQTFMVKMTGVPW